MNILKKLDKNNATEIETFGLLKVACVLMHADYAEKLGLNDLIKNSYTLDRALRHLNEENYFQYIIQVDSKVVGCLEVVIRKSDIDNLDILFLNDLYIVEN